MSDREGFARIGTFLRSAYVERPTSADADVAVIGVPYDEGTTARAGTREGPRTLRDVSANWAYREGVEPFWDGEAGASLLGGVRFVDTGDVHLAPMTPPEVGQESIAVRAREVVTAGLFPVVLGGDHSITFPVLQGVASARAAGLRGSDASPLAAGGQLHLVHFDTHMDYWDEIGGQRYTHASPIIRAHEAGLLAGITQYGIRGLHTVADNIELARSRGVVSFWCEQAKLESAETLVAHLEPGADTWVTFDIDCLDPAIAPGTGTPEPGGFTYYEAKALLLAVAARVNVVGMDLVEVNPLYDPAQLAALHGARLILDLVGAVMRRRTSAT
jgi:agmatinase